MSSPYIDNQENGLGVVSSPVGTALQLNYPNQGDIDNTRCPSDLRAITWPEGKRVDLTWTNPTDVTRIVIKRSQTGHSAFIQDSSEVIYNGPPIEHFIDGVTVTATIGLPALVQTPPELEIGVPSTGVDLDEDSFYYYTLYMTAADVPIGVLDFNGEALERCQVTGLSITDYRNDGSASNYNQDYFYRAFDAATRDMDQFQAAAEGRTTGYHEDFARFLQATVNFYRGMNQGLMKLADPGVSPAGLVGEAFDQASILKAWVRLFNIPPERFVLDVNVLRRLATSMIFIYKEKGTCEGVQDFVKAVTLWDSTCVDVGDQLQGFFLETWDGLCTCEAFSYPASLLAAAPGTLIIPAGVLTPNLFDGGTFTNSAGQFLPIASNDVDLITLQDPTATVLFEELVTINSVTGIPSTATVTANDGHLLNDGEYDGQQILDSANTLRSVVTTNYLGTQGRLLLDGTLVVGAGSIAPTFTLGANFAARDPQTIFRVYYGGTFTSLWEPLESLAVTGNLSILFTGGSLLQTPFNDGDIIVEVVSGVAHAIGEVETLTVLTSTTVELLDSTADFGPPDTLIGYYLNANENHTSVWRIISNTTTKLVVELENPSISPINVAEAGTSYAVLSTPNTRRFQQLNRLLKQMIPEHTRFFVHFL